MAHRECTILTLPDEVTVGITMDMVQGLPALHGLPPGEEAERALLLDLVALIPFYLDILLENGFRLFGNRHQFRGGLVLRVLRLLRVFSLLRLERQLEALQILVQVFRSRSNELLVGDQPASPLVC